LPASLRAAEGATRCRSVDGRRQPGSRGTREAGSRGSRTIGVRGPGRAGRGGALRAPRAGNPPRGNGLARGPRRRPRYLARSGQARRGQGAAARSPRSNEVRAGRVCLVGAGPGDPGLLTLRAAERLREAEVVVYDRLVNPALLDLAPPEALRIFAGKRVGAHCLPQGSVNALLIHHAEAGRCVGRLKGREPGVFGCGGGGEVALALAKAGSAVEIVPGISSAIAGPAHARIPVTHRGMASSFAVLTGHEDPAKDGEKIDWARLATAVDTLVVLMAVGTFPK